MSDLSFSLLARDALDRARAPFLFSETQISEMSSAGIDSRDRVAAKGLYTGEHLFTEQRESYDAIVRLLAEGGSVRLIKRLLHCHHKTIEAVREREGATIDTLRLSIGKRALAASARLLESMEEDIDEDRLKPNEKAFVLSVLVDKGQVLTGGVTDRVERVDSQDLQQSLKDQLADLPVFDVDALPLAEATIVEPARTGSKAGKTPALSEGEAGGSVTLPVLLSAENVGLSIDRQ